MSEAPPDVPVRPFEVSHRLVFRLAVPMTLAYLSLPLVGIIDTAAIGRLGQAALVGGIAVGSIVFDIVFTTFNFLRSGTTGLTAQAYGAEDGAEVAAVLLRALLVAFASAVAILILQWPLIEAGVALMDPGPEVVAAMRTYLIVRIWVAPFTLANFVLLGWLLGLGRSLTVLLVQTVFAALNISLSLYFVLGLGMGVAGVAWSSILAEFLTLIVQVLLILRSLARGPRPSWPQVFDRTGFARLIGINRDIMIRSFSLLFAFAFFTRQGAHFGAVILAANAVLMHFYMLGGYFLDGFATAAEQLSGRAIGARFRPAFERVVRLTTVWGLATALFLAATFALAGPFVIDLMTTSPEVRAAARNYLFWAALTPLIATTAFQMDGIFIGATWSRDMRNMMLLSVLIYLVAWLALTPRFGNNGLWAAFLIFLGARSTLFHWRMRRLLPRRSPPAPDCGAARHG